MDKNQAVYWANIVNAENARKIVKILVDSGADGDMF